LESLAALEALQHLSIHDCTAVGGSLQTIVSLTNLTVLDVSGSAVTGELWMLMGFENLTFLGIQNCTGTIGSLSFLGTLTKLRTLEASHSAFTGTLTGLGSCSSLQKLRAAHNRLEGGLSALKTLTNLTVVDLAFNNLFLEYPIVTLDAPSVRLLNLSHNEAWAVQPHTQESARVELVIVPFNAVVDILGQKPKSLHNPYEHNSHDNPKQPPQQPHKPHSPHNPYNSNRERV
jgi:Leucine-rich repeat (LRR) protein